MNFVPNYSKKVTWQASRHSLDTPGQPEVLMKHHGCRQNCNSSLTSPLDRQHKVKICLQWTAKKRLIFKPFIYEYFFG